MPRIWHKLQVPCSISHSNNVLVESIFEPVRRQQRPGQAPANRQPTAADYAAAAEAAEDEAAGRMMMMALDPEHLAGSMLATAVHGQRTILARSFRLYPKACSRSLRWQHACQDH